MVFGGQTCTPFLKRVRFKTYKALEEAITHGVFVIYQFDNHIFTCSYNLITNSITLKNLEIGSIHDIWKVNDRTVNDEYQYPLDRFMSFDEVKKRNK